MTDNPPGMEMIHLLIEHELALANLYTQFHSTFSRTVSLWEGLILEKKTHAEWIRKLLSMVQKDQISLGKTRLHPNAIKTSIEYIKKTILRTRQGVLSEKMALNIARDLETALIEKSFLEVFKFMGTQFEDLKNHLDQATRKHFERIVVIQKFLQNLD